MNNQEIVIFCRLSTIFLKLQNLEAIKMFDTQKDMVLGLMPILSR